MAAGIIPPGCKPCWDDMTPQAQANLIMFHNIYKHDQNARLTDPLYYQ